MTKTAAPFLLAVSFVAACSMLAPSLEDEVRSANRFRLVEDDGRSAVYAPRVFTRDVAGEWGRLVRDERKRVEDFFAAPLPGKLDVYLVESFPASFDGDAFSIGARVYLRLPGGDRPAAKDGDLLAHEIAHAVLAVAFGIERPFWFEEGLATYVEGLRLGYGAGGRDLLAGLSGVGSISPESLTLDGLSRQPRQLAYRLSAAAVELIIERHGMTAIRRLQREPADRGFDDALFRVTGERRESLEARWREEVRHASRPRALAQ